MMHILGEVRFFAGAAVVGREVVKGDDGVTAFKQTLSDMTADETGGSSYQHLQS
jgi:hypothetical protein